VDAFARARPSRGEAFFRERDHPTPCRLNTPDSPNEAFSFDGAPRRKEIVDDWRPQAPPPHPAGGNLRPPPGDASCSQRNRRRLMSMRLVPPSFGRGCRERFWKKTVQPALSPEIRSFLFEGRTLAFPVVRISKTKKSAVHTGPAGSLRPFFGRDSANQNDSRRLSWNLLADRCDDAPAAVSHQHGFSGQAFPLGGPLVDDALALPIEPLGRADPFKTGRR